MASADCWNRRDCSHNPAPAFGVKPTPGPGFQLSLDKTLTFAAQALDLPMRTNEDGFVMLGPLTDRTGLVSSFCP